MQYFALLSLVVCGFIGLGVDGVLVEDVRDQVVQEMESAWKNLEVKPQCIKRDTNFRMSYLECDSDVMQWYLCDNQGLESDPTKPLGQKLKDLSAIVSKIPDIINRVERELTVYEYDESLKSLGKVKKYDNKC